MSEDKLVFSHNEVFKTDPNNKDKVIMRIPNDIMKKQGWRSLIVVTDSSPDGSLIEKFVG